MIHQPLPLLKSTHEFGLAALTLPGPLPFAHRARTSLASSLSLAHSRRRELFLQPQIILTQVFQRGQLVRQLGLALP